MGLLGVNLCFLWGVDELMGVAIFSPFHLFTLSPLLLTPLPPYSFKSIFLPLPCSLSEKYAYLCSRCHELTALNSNLITF